MTTQDNYNIWFQGMLKKHLHRPHEVTKQSHEGVEYYIAEIPHRNNKDKNISISSYGTELTLFFCEHHEHHDSFEDDNHEEEFKYLCEYIEDIINDKVFFGVAYKNGNVSSYMASYDQSSLVEPEDDKIEVKTWSGKHDKTIKN